MGIRLPEPVVTQRMSAPQERQRRVGGRPVLVGVVLGVIELPDIQAQLDHSGRPGSTETSERGWRLAAKLIAPSPSTSSARSWT